MSWPLGTNDLKQRKKKTIKRKLFLVFCEQKQGDPSAPARSSATARSSASALLVLLVLLVLLALPVLY